VVVPKGDKDTPKLRKYVNTLELPKNSCLGSSASSFSVAEGTREADLRRSRTIVFNEGITSAAQKRRMLWKKGVDHVFKKR
jgi:hypothetical protein